MPGPSPKPAALRQRRNRQPTAANLPSEEQAANNEVPALFDRAAGEDGVALSWHPMVVEWWHSVWTSPMASEYLDADMKGGLYQLASLHQDFWESTSRAARVACAAEIRLQEVRFGLSPIDRRRLQWEIEKGEGAAEKTQSRRARKAPTPGKDPRQLLKAV